MIGIPKRWRHSSSCSGGIGAAPETLKRSELVSALRDSVARNRMFHMVGTM
jgi:hypothetical protein